MLELINVSNDNMSIGRLFNNSGVNLENFLDKHFLDGVELIFSGEYEEKVLPQKLIHGVHLCYWPSWLDFWRENKKALLSRFENNGQIKNYYLAETPEQWVEVWKGNIRQALEVGAEYVVFHVSESPVGELYSRNFRLTDDEVVNAVVELVNEITREMPEKCRFLFENIWWPGLTFQKAEIAERLLNETNFSNTGFMLDTGHLMTTNPELGSEEEAAEYVTRIYHQLGDAGKYIYGLHLHKSLSGEYIKAMMKKHAGEYWPRGWKETAEYISGVDRHEPFLTEAVQKIVEEIKPEYLVHEFLSGSLTELEHNVHLQRHALGRE